MRGPTAPDGGPRVVSVYDGFFAGGARILHTAVVRALQAGTAQQHAVLSLTDRCRRESTTQQAHADTSYRALVADGIPVTALRRSGRRPLRPSHLAALERVVATAEVVLSLKEQPLAALGEVDLAGRPVLTCLHRSDPENQGRALEDLVDLVDRGVVSAAVCCARSTQSAYHQATGIPLDRLPVISNGVDLRRFRPDAADRSATRRTIGAVGDAPVVLLAARFDPMKDVPLFVRAAACLVRTHPDAHLVLCGAGMSADNRDLTDLLTGTLRRWPGATEQVHLMGIRDDMPSLFRAADLTVLTSAYGEAAPLSLIEGMACGAVPVTTDVGDAAAIVADPRLVVAREAAAVAAGWSAAWEQRDEHVERIRRERDRLSDEHCFSAYADLLALHAGAGIRATAS